jgi:hypothetical protein
MEGTNKNPSLGETRVRVDFNVANSSDVTKVKIESANIDFMQSLRVNKDGVSASSEKQRLISMAQTAYGKQECGC